jgi:hypothetical protein
MNVDTFQNSKFVNDFKNFGQAVAVEVSSPYPLYTAVKNIGYSLNDSVLPILKNYVEPLAIAILPIPQPIKELIPNISDTPVQDKQKTDTTTTSTSTSTTPSISTDTMLLLGFAVVIIMIL